MQCGSVSAALHGEVAMQSVPDKAVEPLTQTPAKMDRIVDRTWR